MKSTWKNGTLLGTVLSVTAMVFALTGSLAAQSSSKTSSADAKFAREAAIGGMMEVDLGKIAVQKASNDKVKQFGQRMVDDHSKANDQLKALAAKDNITLPTEIGAKHQAMVDKLSALSGAAFDRAYMRDMVKDHETDIAEFQKEADNGTNPDLKSWAGSTLSTLQGHLTMAKDAENALGITSKK